MLLKFSCLDRGALSITTCLVELRDKLYIAYQRQIFVYYFTDTCLRECWTYYNGQPVPVRHSSTVSEKPNHFFEPHHTRCSYGCSEGKWCRLNLQVKKASGNCCDLKNNKADILPHFRLLIFGFNLTVALFKKTDRNAQYIPLVLIKDFFFNPPAYLHIIRVGPKKNHTLNPINSVYTPDAAASIDADESELSCHSNSQVCFVFHL